MFSYGRWEDLSDSEVAARLVARGVPPAAARAAVSDRDRDQRATAFIDLVLNGRPG